MSEQDLRHYFDLLAKNLPVVLLALFWVGALILRVTKQVKKTLAEAPAADSTQPTGFPTASVPTGPTARRSIARPVEGMATKIPATGPWSSDRGAGGVGRSSTTPSLRELERARPYRPIEPR